MDDSWAAGTGYLPAEALEVLALDGVKRNSSERILWL